LAFLQPFGRPSHLTNFGLFATFWPNESFDQLWPFYNLLADESFDQHVQIGKRLSKCSVNIWTTFAYFDVRLQDAFTYLDTVRLA
jgi:hypothetical protein